MKRKKYKSFSFREQDALRALDRVIALKQGEGKPFAILFFYYFCLVALTIAAKAARDACFLSRYDKSLLPIMFGAGAAAVAVGVAVYSRLANRFGVRTALNLSNGLFAVSLVLLQPRIAGFLISVSYVWLEVITVVTMLQFWLLTPSIFDARRAKRLYGPIAGGGSLGAIAMGLSLKPFVRAFGSEWLLYLSCRVDRRELAACSIRVEIRRRSTESEPTGVPKAADGAFH